MSVTEGTSETQARHEVPRQVGKSTACALLAVATLVTTPGALAIVIAPALRQSQELFRSAMGFLRRLPAAPEIVAESALRVELANASRLIALPAGDDGKNIRGFASVDLIVCDEAARCSDELLATIRPMVAVSRGRLVCLTTPAGRRGFFHRERTEGEDWHRVRVAAGECPRISKAFLDEERRALGPLAYSQEYELQFLGDALAVFPSELIDAAVSNQVEVLYV